MTLTSLLRELADEGLVDRSLVDPATPAGQAARAALAPYSRDMLRLQQAGSSGSVWVGALMLAWFLIASDLLENAAVAGLIGAGALAFAATLARAPTSLVQLQMLWIAVIGGQTLIFYAVGESSRSTVVLSLAGLALQVATLVLVPNLAIGVTAVAVGVFCLTGLIAELTREAVAGGALALVLGTCTAALWVHESALVTRLGRLWQPLAYALPLALFAPLTQSMEGQRDPLVSGVLTAGWSALSIWLISQASREAPGLAGRARLLAWTAVALSGLVAYRAPGLAAGLMLLLLSQLRGGRALQVLALWAIGGYLFFWYYELESSLLTKSAAAVGNGLVFLLAAGLLRRGAGRLREGEARPVRARLGDLRWLLAALGLALAIPTYVVATKEAVLAAQQTVLLRLRPVDPRSLMQGDYMRLAYALIDEVPDKDSLPDRGALVITRDADNVARFVRIDAGRPLGPGELRLRYFKREHGISLGAETFLFPEGEGATLAEAAYGELALGEAGDSVLIGLRDAQRRPLGTRLHDLRE